MQRICALLAGGMAAALVAGCGGSSNAPAAHTGGGSATVTRTVTVLQPAPTTTTSTTTGGTGTSTTPVAATTPACTAAMLTPVFLGSNGATGNVVLSFALRNRGAAPCHTYGWPGVAFLDGTGRVLDTGSVRTRSDILGATPATAIVLAPGKEASFRMVVPDQNSGSRSGYCTNADQLQIIAPDDTATMRVGISGGVTECGKTSVSPLQPGSSALGGT